MPRRTLIGSALLAFVLVGSAQAATPKPKPWQWTPAVARVQVAAAQPDMFGPHDKLTVSKCQARGNGTKGRYVAFRCAAFVDYSALSETDTNVVLWVKVRRQAKGQPCISTVSFAAIPAGCLDPVGARVRTTAADARNQMRAVVGEHLGTSFPYQAIARCTAYGAGYFVCWWGAGEDGPTAGHLNLVFRPAGALATFTNEPQP